MPGLNFARKKEPLRSIYQVYYYATLPVRLASWIFGHYGTTGYRKNHTMLESLLVQSYRSITEMWTYTGTGPRGNYLGRLDDEKRKALFKKTGTMHTIIPSSHLRELHEPIAHWNNNNVGQNEAHDVEANWIGKRAILEQKAADPEEKVILYLHAGAYLIGSANPQNPAAALPLHLLSTISEHSASTQLPQSVLAPEFRLSHLAPWPAPLIDGLTSWFYLTDLGFKPSNIVILGDSSGAHLTLSLTRYLKNFKNTLPAANIVPSPWMDLSGSINTENTSWCVYSTEDSLPDIFVDEAVSALMGSSLDEKVLNNEYVSPGSLNVSIYNAKTPLTLSQIENQLYVGWCPIHITVGTRDKEYDHALRLQHLVTTSNSMDLCKLHVMPGVPHDPFQYPHKAFQNSRKKALVDMTDWLSTSVFFLS